MARGRGSLRDFDRQPSGRWVAPSRNCPACGLCHPSIPERCQRVIDRSQAVSLSDRHRAPAPVAPLIAPRRSGRGPEVMPQDGSRANECPR